MGSIISDVVSTFHGNRFNSQGQVVDVPTTLGQPRGTFQEDHNQAPMFPVCNQDKRGAEGVGNSTITPML